MAVYTMCIERVTWGGRHTLHSLFDRNDFRSIHQPQKPKTRVFDRRFDMICNDNNSITNLALCELTMADHFNRTAGERKISSTPDPMDMTETEYQLLHSPLTDPLSSPSCIGYLSKAE